MSVASQFQTEFDMATQNDFTPDEWKRLLASPLLAGMAVTMADPSGLFGTIKEAAAGGMALAEAKTAPASNPLMKAISSAIGTSEGRGLAQESLKAEVTGKSAGEVKAEVIAGLTEVGQILDAKAQADAPGVKAWLKHIAEKVAESSSEGGFLGFGGVKVSDAEKATLAEIAAALKIAA
jgi:hypothetical protein